MPSTRRQAAHNTRSTGRATHQLGIREKRKRNVSKSNLRETPTSAQLDDHWARFDFIRRSLGNHWAKEGLELAYEIYLCFLLKDLPVVSIIAKKFRGTYPLYTLFVTAAILMARYAFYRWQSSGTAEFLVDIYYNNALQPPNHSWIIREDVSHLMEQIKRLSEGHNGKEIHVYFTGRPGSGKSELARQLGVRLKESQKQSKRPMAVITIQANNDTYLLSSFKGAIEAVVRQRRDPQVKIEDIKKQIDYEHNYEMYFKENEEDRVQKTRTKLKVLCNKLVELLENTRLPVLIFDNVHDLEVLNSLNLKPGNDHLATFVIIITLQNNVSLDGLPSDYVHVQDLSQGMSLNDTVKLLKLFFTGLEGEHSYTELSNILGRLSPQELSRRAISLQKGHVLHLEHIADIVCETQIVRLVYNFGGVTYVINRHLVYRYVTLVVNEVRVVPKIQYVYVYNYYCSTNMRGYLQGQNSVFLLCCAVVPFCVFVMMFYYFVLTLYHAVFGPNVQLCTTESHNQPCPQAFSAR